MRKIRIVFLFFVIVFSVVSVSPAFAFVNPKPLKRTQNYSPDEKDPFPNFLSSGDIEDEIHFLVNRQRRKYRLKNLTLDRKISRMARYYSKKMAKDDFFDHYDPDGNSVVDRAKKFKIKNYLKIGENLFYGEGYRDPSSIAVRGWLESPSHRRNMLARDWSHTGIGVYITRDNRIYVTQVFLRK